MQHTTCDFEHGSGKVVSRSGTCISTGTATDIHTCRHTYVSKYIHTYIRTSTYAHKYTHRRICTHNVCMHMCTYIHWHAYEHTYIQIFKQTHRHTTLDSSTCRGWPLTIYNESRRKQDIRIMCVQLVGLTSSAYSSHLHSFFSNYSLIICSFSWIVLAAWPRMRP